jgi:serine protease Do
MPFRILIWPLVLLLACPAMATDELTRPEADPVAMPEMPTQRDVQTVAQEAREALVVFNVADRDGRDKGIGTGFFVSDDGLIATNLHVIGEGREFTIELANGQKVPVREVHAADRHLDLALIRVDVPENGWRHLPLGEPNQLTDGSPIVVMGNPYGLKSSVVSGVLSGRREVDGRTMLQLAVPIEPGNSGGPVLDMEGRVHGVVTMKSLVTENLGFAVESQALATLLARPNPVPLERWVTIGSLDSRQWTTRFGANWRQRAGMISVEGTGDGFGGRALCLATALPPELPFELAVSVKLDNEAGAAGLVFHADGEDRHYGFYPSNGQLRISCFDGPSVFQWRVLRESPSDAYRTGEWNRLRVRVDGERLQCFVNEELVFDLQDSTFAEGRIGLAKFRDTKAQFRGFEVGKTLEITPLDDDQQQQFIRALDRLTRSDPQDATELQTLLELGPSTPPLLEQQARELRRQADALLQAADEVRLQLVLRELEAWLESEQPDLLRGALLVAKLDDGQLDMKAYLREVDRMASEVREQLDEDADSSDTFAALNRYLFEENGYHGSRQDYYHPANSYLNRVIDDREGIPITLSVLYLELGKRLDLDLEGVGLPGHFIVRWREEDDKEQLVDVFENARLLDRDAVKRIVRTHTGGTLRDEHLQAVSEGDILRRMLGNLVGIAQRDRNSPALRRYLEAIVRVDPETAHYRGMRAIARFEAGQKVSAIEDLEWFLEHEPADIDLDRIRELKQLFERRGTRRAP